MPQNSPFWTQYLRTFGTFTPSRRARRREFVESQQVVYWETGLRLCVVTACILTVWTITLARPAGAAHYRETYLRKLAKTRRKVTPRAAPRSQTTLGPTAACPRWPAVAPALRPTRRRRSAAAGAEPAGAAASPEAHVAAATNIAKLHPLVALDSRIVRVAAEY